MSELSAIRTVEDLKDALARARRHPENVGRVGDRGLSRAEGSSAIRTLPDGRAEIVTFGRGENDDHIEAFPSEMAAVQELARVLLQPVPPARGADEDARDAQRMQHRAQDVLARLRARHGGAQ
ncbi:hypothetical protein [Nocardioides sp. Iso805N]|uniref:hypothetical protein n=1 Tax=Nocardioides sp. Iso805N TaxID=1283287 RepID=UPI00035C6153|nr:hypothetical protein [Nocardioides sp. Iso805N]